MIKSGAFAHHRSSVNSKRPQIGRCILVEEPLRTDWHVNCLLYIMDYTGHSPGFEYVLTLYEKLHYFRSCSPEDILSLVTAVIPQDRLLLQYFKSLSNEDRTVCYRAAMICWAVTISTMVPREMQFRVVLSDFQQRNCLIAAGTGSGKTLPLLCLLRSAFSLTTLLPTPSRSPFLLSNSFRSPRSRTLTLTFKYQLSWSMKTPLAM